MLKFSTVLIFLILLLFTGCDRKNPETLFMEATENFKSGNNEKAMNILHDLATNYSETKAGFAAAQLINNIKESYNKEAFTALKNFKMELLAYFEDNKVFQKNIESLIASLTTKSMLPKQNSTFSDFVEKKPEQLRLRENITILYTTNKKGGIYQICSYHDLGQKAYCESSDDTTMFEIGDVEGLKKKIATEHQKVGEIPGLIMYLTK